MERKPDWLKVRFDSVEINRLYNLLNSFSLNTVCKEAGCPNIGECFKKHTATFLIMGRNCTRHCKFCNVAKNPATALDPKEPENVAKAAIQMQLRHIVITSVTRDDLPDGGARHFSETVKAVRSALPGATVELLIPDMGGIKQSLDIILSSDPDILGHNIETVPSLYSTVRPEADYCRSLAILEYVKQANPSIISKTGLMVGLGETYDEITKVMDDLAGIGCDILTIGQYLRPSKEHLEVKEYVTPQIFDEYASLGREKGISYVFSGPLVRSSYHAAEAYDKLHENN